MWHTRTCPSKFTTDRQSVGAMTPWKANPSPVVPSSSEVATVTESFGLRSTVCQTSLRLGKLALKIRTTSERSTRGKSSAQ